MKQRVWLALSSDDAVLRSKVFSSKILAQRYAQYAKNRLGFPNLISIRSFIVDDEGGLY